jgi:glucuronosyltransferase
MRLVTVLTLCCVCSFAESQPDRHQAAVNHHPDRSSSSHDADPSRLAVLLISVPLAGHVNPLLALGEELAGRGHNVTLCVTNDPKFTESIKSQVAKVGVNLIATGQSRLKTVIGENAGKGAISSGLLKFPTIAGNEIEIILNFTKTFIEQNSVDIVISEEFLAAALMCVSRRYRIPSLIMSSTFQVMSYTYPSWPWPGMISGAVSDNLTFRQRLFVPFERLMFSVLLNYIMIPSTQSKLGKFCPSLTSRYVSIASGTHLPQIIPSVIGVEYPRTISPLTHYVGPVLTKSPAPLPTDLQLWLSEKDDRSVIYISMGSHMPTSEELGSTIVNVIAKSSYSAVWALRNSSLLEALPVQLDKGKLFVTSWAPQLTVLGHRAIRMAILHGGANGVHEALYNEVPVILLPGFGDQMFLAGRISHNKFGVHIPAENLRLSSFSDAIKQIDDGDYIRNIQRLKKIFIQAGGVKRAADLVEHYQDVGYSHLVPAYAKYDWNWIQYYNVDVYLLLGTLLGLVLYASFRCCKCACSRCCTCFQSKEKAD